MVLLAQVLSIYLAYFTPLQKEGLFITFPVWPVSCSSHPCNALGSTDLIQPASALPASAHGVCTWCPNSVCSLPSTFVYNSFKNCVCLRLSNCYLLASPRFRLHQSQVIWNSAKTMSSFINLECRKGKWSHLDGGYVTFLLIPILSSYKFSILCETELIFGFVRKLR